MAFLGALYAGNVPVIVSTELNADEYARIMTQCRPRAMVIGHALQSVLSEARSKPVFRPRNIWVSRDSPSGFAVSTQCQPMSEPYPTRADDAAFWLYTSGRTCPFKATVHSHASIRHTAVNYGEGVLVLTETDVCFSASKLYCAYGLGHPLSFPL